MKGCWPWASLNYFYNNKFDMILKTNFEIEPPFPPIIPSYHSFNHTFPGHLHTFLIPPVKCYPKNLYSKFIGQNVSLGIIIV